MRVRNKVLLSVGTILVAFAVTACVTSTPYEAESSMPSLETEAQLAAARDCQAVYARCVRTCYDTRPAANEPRPIDDESLNACRASLDECYGACERMEPLTADAEVTDTIVE